MAGIDRQECSCCDALPTFYVLFCTLTPSAGWGAFYKWPTRRFEFCTSDPWVLFSHPLQLLLHPHTHTSCIKQLEYGWLFKFEHSVCAFNLNFNLNFKPKCAMCVHLGQEIKEYIYVHIYI